MEPSTLQTRLLILIRHPRRHLRREQTRRDTIRPDPQRHERMRPLLGQMQKGRLARRVRELALGMRLGDPRRAGDIDDVAGVSRDGLAALAQ